MNEGFYEIVEEHARCLVGKGREQVGDNTDMINLLHFRKSIRVARHIHA